MSKEQDLHLYGDMKVKCASCEGEAYFEYVWGEEGLDLLEAQQRYLAKNGWGLLMCGEHWMNEICPDCIGTVEVVKPGDCK